MTITNIDKQFSEWFKNHKGIYSQKEVEEIVTQAKAEQREEMMKKYDQAIRELKGYNISQASILHIRVSLFGTMQTSDDIASEIRGQK